jgi:homoserine kinase
MEKSAVRVRVPATSANLGPGFDTLGIALQLYSHVVVEVSSTGENQVIMLGEGREYGERPIEENIAWQAIGKLAERTKSTFPPLHLTLENSIPLARGLGSSAAARVGAVVAANLWLARDGQPHLNQEQLLELATELEGHPDNVAPALLGGMISSAGDGGKVLSSALSVPCWPRFMVFVPDTELSTKAARDVLPHLISHQDAVFNLSRLGMLITVMSSGAWRENPALLRTSLQDRLHQIYRAALMPAYGPVEEAALAKGALGVTLSGAGPSILIWMAHDVESTFMEMMKNVVQQTAAAQGVTGKMIEMEVDETGCVEV